MKLNVTARTLSIQEGIKQGCEVLMFHPDLLPQITWPDVSTILQFVTA